MIIGIENGQASLVALARLPEPLNAKPSIDGIRESGRSREIDNDRVPLQSDVLERVLCGVFPLLADKDRCTESEVLTEHE